MVQRYDPVHFMKKAENGDYVEYEDYKKLVKIKEISYEAICTGDQEASEKAIGLIEAYEQALKEPKKPK